MAASVRILLVEDIDHEAEMALRLLRRGGLDCDGRRVDTEERFREQLDAFDPHVVLSDFSMPRFDGMSALSIARQLRPQVPFIFVSGTIGETFAIDALKNGATDYVLKHDLGRLAPAVERALQDAHVAREQQRMQEALRVSELRFRLAASTGDVWDWSVDSGEAYISHQWKQRLGYADHEIDNTAQAWLALLHPDDRPRVLQAFASHLRDRVPYDVEYRARTCSGDYRWSHAKGQAVWDESGRATYMAGSVVDITERKLAEIRVRRLNRVHATLSGITSLIVHVQTREELFRESCRVAVHSGQFLLAWLGLVDRPGGRLVPVACSGMGQDDLLRLPLGLNPRDTSQYGAPGLAVSTRQAVIVQDVTADVRMMPGNEALASGVRSLAVLPIEVSGDVVAVLALHAGEAGFFDAAEVRLLTDLASDVAFALDHIDKAERLNYLAYYDALTGLANRALFHDRLAQFVERARREQHRLAVLVVDVDRFRNLNDTLGRAAGDELLRQVAQRLAGHADEAGRLARIEGDHFAIVEPEIRSEEDVARGIAQRLQACFGTPFQVAGSEMRLAARVGVAVFPHDGDDVETLFRHAEAAAKKAKARGERFLFYAQEMTEKIAGTLALENRLRQALEKGEFALHYQPKVDGATRRVLGVEALLRWHSPELGLVPPARFIGLMEETGLILEAGAWALRQAVHDRRRWAEMGLPQVPRVAVNVSQIQLRKQDFIDSLKDALAGDDPPPGIDLELTETLVMDDIEANIGKLMRIRDLGVQIAIDDFGTGYSSLHYLAKLPVHVLKIDRSFVVRMTEDAHTMTLVSTIVSLAHSLDLVVVAEGVETEAQADILVRLGCDEMQGYLFSKPLPWAGMTALLQQQQESS